MMSIATNNALVSNDGKSSRYLPFGLARDHVRSLNLNSVKEYRTWAKSKQRPADIPTNPDTYYKGDFISWDDFMGYAPLPYVEAKAIAQKMGIRTRKEWEEHAAQGKLPRNIPKWPDSRYKGEFTTWADWLGRTADSRFRSFEAARDLVRSLELKSRREYTDFVQSDACPKDIPSAPDVTYSGKGWVSYDDFLGYAPTRFTRTVVLGLLRSLGKTVRTLSSTEIYAILQAKGVIGKRFPTNRNAGIMRSLQKLCNSSDPTNVILQLADQLQTAQSTDTGSLAPEQGESSNPSDINHEASRRNLSDEGPTAFDAPPVHNPEPTQSIAQRAPMSEALTPKACREVSGPEIEDELKAVDEVARNLAGFDDDLLQFLVSNRVSRLWHRVFSEDPTFDVERFRDVPGDAYFQEIKRQFFEQYDGANNLPLPAAYGFTVAGRPAPPTQMQRLTAYRVLTEKRIGNWSGVGAGKTVAAIHSALVVDARVTVVLAFNSTLEKWKEDIQTTCPGAMVLVKQRGPYQLDPERPTFLLFNYESFQQTWAETELIPNLVDYHRVDFVILDEVQSARQRTEEQESTRLRLVKSLVNQAAARNPLLRVLGMTATPAINNLYEVLTILMLITGLDFSHSPTEPTVENAIRYHRHLTRHGLRYRPRHSEVGEPRLAVVDGVALLPELAALPKAGYIAKLEQLLLKAKLAAILPLVRPGTLIYTQFVEEIVEPLKLSIKQMGLSVGLYTGEVKSGLTSFKSRLDDEAEDRADVLIGSAPIGTGIDGLQHVCDNLIFACLPWTGADYEQVVGRLTRLGGRYDKIEVHIPVVELTAPDGSTWSWDRYRLEVLRFKKTIADAVVDGVIPEENRLPTKEEMYRKSIIALKEWEERLLSSSCPADSDDEQAPSSGGSLNDPSFSTAGGAAEAGHTEAI